MLRRKVALSVGGVALVAVVLTGWWRCSGSGAIPEYVLAKVYGRSGGQYWCQSCVPCAGDVDLYCTMDTNCTAEDAARSNPCPEIHTERHGFGYEKCVSSWGGEMCTPGPSRHMKCTSEAIWYCDLGINGEPEFLCRPDEDTRVNKRVFLPLDRLACGGEECDATWGVWTNCFTY